MPEPTTNPPAILTIAPGDAIDLQMHTTYSDGSWAPDALLAYLAEQRFRVVAITDHDQVTHIPETQALGQQHGVVVIPALEMTTLWHGVNADILCFAPLESGFIGDDLANVVRRTEEGQLANTHAVHAELLRQGYTFPHQMEVLLAQGSELRRPGDNMLLLQAHGYAQSPGQALKMIWDAGYRSIKAPIAEGLAAAHASGAITILAHPGRSDGEIHRFDLPELVELLDEQPLDGIETYYPVHTPEQTQTYHRLAQERGLLESAGSDSHSLRHRAPIPYPAQYCAGLLARLGVSVG